MGGLKKRGGFEKLPVGMGRREAVLKLVGVGWYIGGCIFLGVWGGLWLDNKLNTKPILTIVGLMVGLGIAFYGVYRMLLPGISKKENEGKR